MTGRRKALLRGAVSLVAVVGVAIGWYRSWPGEQHPFASCRIDLTGEFHVSMFGATELRYPER